jgi:hypothetical protein
LAHLLQRRPRIVSQVPARTRENPLSTEAVDKSVDEPLASVISAPSDAPSVILAKL